MRVSLKKMIQDIRGLTDEYPEAYAYSVVLEASDALASHAAAADPALVEKRQKFQESTAKILKRLETEPLDNVKKSFFLEVQKPWNMVNVAAKKQPKEDRKMFLQRSTEFFWNTMGEIDKKAQTEQEGRRYGAFWIPFLIGATALGGIFAYSSGKSTKEYIDTKEKEMSPVVYAGIGAAAVLGIAIVMRR